MCLLRASGTTVRDRLSHPVAPLAPTIAVQDLGVGHQPLTVPAVVVPPANQSCRGTRTK